MSTTLKRSGGVLPLLTTTGTPPVVHSHRSRRLRRVFRCLQRNEQGGGTGVPESTSPLENAGEEHYDPTRKDNIRRRNETRLALEKTQRSTCCAGQSPEVCGKFVLQVSARLLGGTVSRNGGRWLPPKFVGKADLGGRLALRGSDG